MGYIQTVCGPAAAETLGHSQIHEHIFVRHTPMADKNPALELDDFDRPLAELNSCRQAGGTFLADAQPVAAGRDALALERLGRESGVLVTASTGYHLLGFYSETCWVHSLEEEDLYRLYRSELEEGMLPWSTDPTRRPEEVTPVKAGLVKAAIPAEGATGRYETLLRAAARVAAACGVPLMLHTEKGAHAPEAVKLCFQMGVPPEKLVVCHVDRQAVDFAPHEAVAKLGVYLDYDTIGRFKYHSDREEVALIRHMTDKGWGERLLLALDTTAQRLASYGGEIGLCYVLNTFLPMLTDAGFTPEELKAFTCGNCRCVFGP